MLEARNAIRVLTWDPVCRRSASIAERLGESLKTIHYLWYRRPWIAPLKYVLQGIATLVWLRRERPATVMVSNPPLFSVLAVYLYCAIYGGQYVVDSHTGVFYEPKWTWLSFLNRFLSRHACFTIVTNAHLKQHVESWGARAAVLEDPLPVLPQSDVSYPVDPSCFNIIGIFSFYEDEPVEEMLAVRHLPPNVRIYITGDHSKLKPELSHSISDQIVLTGFLSDADYVALLRQCDAALVLCTRPHTLLCGAYEAVAGAKPVITSESEDMRAYFSKGTVFVENTPAGIEQGIADVQQWHVNLVHEVIELRKEIDQHWENRFANCLAQLELDRIKGDGGVI